MEAFFRSFRMPGEPSSPGGMVHLIQQGTVFLPGHRNTAHSFQVVCVKLTVDHEKLFPGKGPGQGDEGQLGAVFHVAEHAFSEKAPP